jgi:site-specific DNA-methyltransferase (adenine-specific)
MRSEVYNSDCLEAMRAMPDNAFDLAIVDPPYGIAASSMNLGFSQSSRIAKHDWDDQPPSPEYFAELRRVARNQIIWGANYFNIFPSKGYVVWDKCEGMYGRSFAECELAYSSFKENARVCRISPNNLTDAKIHKCQKPVVLYKWLLTNYAKTGDTILDTHLGSGSSRIAAYDLGFDFTGYELDTDYFNAQEQRFADHIAQPKLWEPNDNGVVQSSMFATV